MDKQIRCEQMLKLISDYLDGELDMEIQALVLEHLRTCNNCTVVVNTTRKMIELYHDDRMVEIPVDIQKRLFDKLENSI